MDPVFSLKNKTLKKYWKKGKKYWKSPGTLSARKSRNQVVILMPFIQRKKIWSFQIGYCSINPSLQNFRNIIIKY